MSVWGLPWVLKVEATSSHRQNQIARWEIKLASEPFYASRAAIELPSFIPRKLSHTTELCTYFMYQSRFRQTVPSRCPDLLACRQTHRE